MCRIPCIRSNLGEGLNSARPGSTGLVLFLAALSNAAFQAMVWYHGNMAGPKRKTPPFLTFEERNQLMLAPLAHFELLRSGMGTRPHLQSITGLLNLASVAAAAKRDETRENIFLMAQSCIVLIASRTPVDEPITLQPDEEAYIGHALKTIDQWLMTLPRARLTHAVMFVERSAARASREKPQNRVTATNAKPHS